MAAYYNENDPYCVDWLRNLMRAGLIADGEVDARSIRDVQPVDLLGFDQCHFFAGIGGWSYALRLAGWPDDRPVFTGSCPCQPFSAAGKRKGEADERHLWPEFLRLIAACRPAVVFGEQVASSDGRQWLAGVRADLEAVAYECGAADLCSAGVGAPHIRQRLWWVADAERGSAERHGYELGSAQGGVRSEARQQRLRADAWYGGAARVGMEHAEGERLHRGENPTWPGGRCRSEDDDRMGDTGDAGLEGRDIRAVGGQCEAAERAGAQRAGGMADADGVGPRAQRGDDRARSGAPEEEVREEHAAAVLGRRSPWSDFDLVLCRDKGGTYRRVEPGTFPLAHGVSGRVGRLRAYGNAINPWVAKEFIEAYGETRCHA